MTNRPIAISACVHQENEKVLRAWLWGISHLDTSGLDIHYSFVLHNPVGFEHDLFAEYLPLWESEVVTTEHKPVIRGQYSHSWGGPTVGTVADAKNRLIELAINHGHDILFCDSDQVMRPETLKRLISMDKSVCGEILWTKWHTSEHERPNAWDFADYIFKQRTEKKLREPGEYQVGFIGGLVYIRHEALKAGVNYARVPNLTFWGEDRHFGVRAAVLGYELWVDTHYPAFHIYRDSDLERLPDWITLNNEGKFQGSTTEECNG
ncbi:MAG: hypothetical protein PHF64_00490 [Methanoregula sp.]|nr:hypothetical protein [Methanoregula sp.]